jgi:hypothetical protein
VVCPRVCVPLISRFPACPVQSIACYDLGEFARIHPKGKSILDETGAKAVLLGLMSTCVVCVCVRACARFCCTMPHSLSQIKES